MRQPLLLAAALGLATAALAQPGRLTPPPAAKAQAPDWPVRYAARITPAALRADLTVLASDAYEGRATGQKGQRMAAEYLAQAFAAAGLAGPVRESDNPYFQHFTINRMGLNPAATAQVGGRIFELNKDFYLALRNPAAASATVRPTFVGYGISTAGYQDFAPAAPDLQHKDVLLLLGEPLTPAGPPLLGAAGQASAYGTAGYPEMMARSPALRTLTPHSSFRIAPSAAAFAEVPQAYPGLFANAERLALPGDPDPAPEGINLFVVSPEMGAAMLGTTPTGVAQYRQAVAAAGRPVAAPFAPVPVALQAGEQRVPFQTENVLGYLEGSDKKAEVVVVSAHYDHVGVQNGVVYNGADDDGSGTVSVLALARAFAQAKREGHGPRRSLLFLAHTAEEVGLLGSRYYAAHPVFPLANTVADLNIDMLGRVDSLHQGKGDYVYVLGDNWRSPDLRRLSEATNQHHQPLALDYTYNTIMAPGAPLPPLRPVQLCRARGAGDFLHQRPAPRLPPAHRRRGED